MKDITEIIKETIKRQGIILNNENELKLNTIQDMTLQEKLAFLNSTAPLPINTIEPLTINTNIQTQDELNDILREGIKRCFTWEEILKLYEKEVTPTS